MCSGAHDASAPAMRSSHQWSRPSVMGVAPPASPVRRATTTCSIDGVSATAVSAFSFSGTTRAAPPPAVGGDEDLGLGVVDPVAQRVGEKPPNTTECGAPMRVQASMATGSSGIMGM